MQESTGVKVAMNPTLWDVVDRVNREVNFEVTYRTDQESYGKSEHWVEAGKYGDCEDYAIKKFRRLKLKGIPEKAMGICACFTENDVYHAVLMLSTDKGDFVLDNRFKRVRAFDKCGYKWQYIPAYLKGEN